MKNWKLFAAIIIMAGAGIFSCSKPNDATTGYTVSVTGTVLRKNLMPLDSVTVITEDPIRRDSIKSADGSFTISFETDEKEAVTTKMTFSRPRFYDTTFSVTYSPTQKETKLKTIIMRAYNSDEDTISITPVSLKPLSIVFVPASGAQSLSIAGSGGVDVIPMTFEARDSLGNAVGLSNQLTIGFRIVSRPDLQTLLNRDTISTNSAGRATVMLSAGQKAGIAQVQAYAYVKKDDGSTDSIKSPIISIPIYGGVADSSHFSLGTTKYNIPGAIKFNLRAPISAIIGDKFGNPAQPGTVVYFTTTGGVIQSSAASNADGLVAVDLITGNPIPAGGIATITAQIGTGAPSGRLTSAGLGGVAASDDASAYENIPQPLKSYVASSTVGGAPGRKAQAVFSRSINILLSGASLIETADTNFVITTGSEKRIDFFVGDANGNPLSEGTTIKVSGAGLDTAGVALSGDVNQNIPDTQDKAFTHFSVIVSDKRTTNLNIGKRITLNFEVNSPNGNTKKTISGYLPPAGASDSGRTGSADSTHFTVFTDKTNYPWISQSGQPIGKVIVQLGDRNGNPVALAPVTLTTNAGSITGSVQTDVNGRAEASLLGGYPLPPNGIGIVTVSALGTSSTITKSVSFYYTGSPILSTPEIARDTVPSIVDGGYADVAFNIMDSNGNPVAAGNSVKVEVIGTGAGDILLSQDFSITTDGVRKNFKFRATDKAPNVGNDGTLAFIITVDGPTGKAVKTLYSTLLGANNIVVPPSVRQPAQIAFIGTTAADISVAGVGGRENSVITYEVRDSLGQPIDKSKRTFATYSLQFFPNSRVQGGTAPRVIPGSDSTNDQGRLMASIISGTQSGTIQLVANISVNGKSIQSEPVKITIHSGFPDQDHFSILPSLFTVLRDDMSSEKFTVAVGDTFSNPVASGTAIYFQSQAGIIATGSEDFNAYTDKNGIATVPFMMVNPHADVRPFYYTPPLGGTYDALIGGRLGYFWVTAQTQGRNNKLVMDSVLILESTLPASILNVPAAVVTLPSGGQSAPISIQVYDVHGNPLPAGTIVSVTADFAQTADGKLKFGISGDSHVMIPNDGAARFRGRGITDFTFSVIDQTEGGAAVGQSLIVKIVVQVTAERIYETSFSARVQ